MPPVPVKLLACGVFERELAALREVCATPFDVEVLDAGLHSRPDQLHDALQAAIDAAAGHERIGLLYGLCGKGAAGLVARDVPLVIPRSHDCVALFLGSADAYREQFRAVPGTLYLTPGWFEKKVHPDSLRLHSMAGAWHAGQHPKFSEWRASYGDENAAMIVAFLEAWRDNYERICLINNGLGEVPRYRDYASDLAAASGWRFEELVGRLEWLRMLVDGPHSPASFLTVPPGHRVVATHDARVFAAVAAGAAGQPDGEARPGRYVFAAAQQTPQRRGLGLGIDAGGTYTDAALLDFGSGEVVDKAKAPTTHRDLTVGVADVLSRLDPARLRRVQLVSLSTTLATNALVEHRGAPVGLLLMPPTDGLPEQISARPVRVLRGRLTIDGRERAPVDEAEVRAAAAELLAAGVAAFAVSGYGAVHNPVHEQQVKAIIEESARLPVVCGHELSGKLDFVRRAHTAVLNARLMPVIGELLDAVEAMLHAHGVAAPLFVVRGDGSLTKVATARERPIETILSGPAASVEGARFLVDERDLVVVDVGGTTTDVAAVSNGRVPICDEGATVGPWRTSVRAAEIMTSGLGGDSHVQLTEGGLQMQVGPGRVEPLSLVALRHPHLKAELRRAAHDALREPQSPLTIECFVLAGTRPAVALSAKEERLLAALEDGPRSRRELAHELGALALQILPTKRLEELGAIRRCAFTPSDALHVLDRFSGYDGEAALWGATVLASFARRQVRELAHWVVETFCERVARTVLRRELSLALGDPETESGAVLDALVQEMLTGRKQPRATFDLRFTAKRTIVGLGAPAEAFVPAAAALLGGRAVVPPHAEVANAVGAVAGRVTIRETLHIQPDTGGGYLLLGTLGRREYGSLTDAQDSATRLLVEHLRGAASRFGTTSRDVVVEVSERRGKLADGGEQFLELVVEGVLEGAPGA
jgi:N-methylhydantoinase A/oxoprolinase/acetone carboxylase beta subunit